MGKIWNKLTKKEPPKPATKKDIEQLKLEVEKASLEYKLNNLKATGKKSTLAGRLWSSFLEHERKQARKEFKL